MEGKKLKIVKIGIEVLFVAGLILASCVLYFSHVTPFHRGFFCSDESLKYPYHEDTVTMGVAAGTGVIAIVITVLVLEGLHTWFFEQEDSKTFVETFKFYAKIVGWNLTIAFFGAGFNFLMTEIPKVTVGRLRPHFFDVCKPDFTSLNCSAGYVTHYSCISSADSDQVLDAHKSFPSGHSSFIAYCMTFVIIYLQLRLPRRSFHLMKSSLQFCSAIIVIYVCTSRVSDYKHHWSDVISGAVLGILVAVFTIGCVSNIRRQKQDGGIEDGTIFPMSINTPSVYKNKDIEGQM